jgi:deoxyribodipyrimidine photolyase-related protein
MKTLRLILGDQLNESHSWFSSVDDQILYCIFEMRQETDYVQHHIQKVIGFFAAMRAFGERLKEKGHRVHYFKINDTKNHQNLEKNIKLLIEQNNIEHFEYQAPDEYRLDEQLRAICSALKISYKCDDSEHFLTTRDELSSFFEGKKQLLMERFYRYMRKKHHILMVGEQPEGGIWNYDHNNRKKWKGSPGIPMYKAFKNEAKTICDDIAKSKIKTIGHFKGPFFEYPINLKQAQHQLSYFCKNLLPYFGDYQDALHSDEVYLFHSRLSFAMNLKIISPREVIYAVLNEYKKNKEAVTIAQVEGFIRQVIGWREYMRGMYWKEMPEYKGLNELGNNEKIPDFFWTGKTKMNCLKKTIKNSLDYAYAHHIQRLMITGNYLLLTQTHPDAVDDWYLGIYIDALQWVQLPNTRGMSQYADGGKIATKPYVSSGSYINKMSNYCSSCQYNVKERLGPNACPFNSLYWNFLDDKKQKLAKNQRMRMMYSVLNKFSSEEVHKMKLRASEIMGNPENY